MDELDILQFYSTLLYLAKKAMNGDYVSYKSFCEDNYIPFENQEDRNKMAHLLGTLSRYTATMEVPHLISSCVVRQNFKERIPGPGFFELAQEIIGYKPSIDKYEFWKQEWKRSCEFWKSSKGQTEYNRLKTERRKLLHM